MKNQSPENAYQRMARLAAITKIFLSSNRNDLAGKCIALASRMYDDGGNEVRNAVVNVYLYTISLYIELKRLRTRELLTPNLLSLYQKQTCECSD